MNTPASSYFFLAIVLSSLLYAGAATYAVRWFCREVMIIPPPSRWQTYGICLMLFFVILNLPYLLALQLSSYGVLGAAFDLMAGLWRSMGQVERVSLIAALLAVSFGLLLWFPTRMRWAEDYSEAFVYFLAVPVLAAGCIYVLVVFAYGINRVLP